MKYIFNGDRGDISLAIGGHGLKRGDTVELTDEQASALLSKDFPITRVNPDIEVKQDGV